jgi:hypothetical protein
VLAPGFQPASIAFEATNAIVLKPSLALNLDSEARAAIGNAVWGDRSATAIGDLAKTLGVDTVIAVSVHSDGRVGALIVRKNSSRAERSAPVARDGVSSLVTWLNDRLGGRPDARLSVRLGSDAALRSKRVRVEFDSGEEHETTRGGGGIGVDAIADYGGSRGELHAGGTSYAQSSAAYETADGEREVSGGTALDLRALASHGIEVWKVEIRPTAGLRYESDTSGGRKSFAVFPAFTRVDALAGLTLGVAGGKGSFEAGAFATSNLMWESSNGWSEAKSPMALLWAARAEMQPGAWTLAATYAGEQRTTNFSGAYPIATAQPLRNPEVGELEHVFSISVGYRVR